MKLIAVRYPKKLRQGEQKTGKVSGIKKRMIERQHFSEVKMGNMQKKKKPCMYMLLSVTV